MKKLMALLITGTMVLTNVPQNVFAEGMGEISLPVESIKSAEGVKSSIYTKEQIEKLVRIRLGLGKDYILEDSNLETRDRQQKQFWRLYFSADQKNITVMADGTSGEITSFDKWDYTNRGRVLHTLPSQAKKAAEEFMKKMYSDRAQQVVEATVDQLSLYKTRYYDTRNYTFLYVRQIGGELFPNNYFRITVSGVNGEVVNYEMKWDEMAYEEGQSLISREEARKIFETNDYLQLKYIGVYEGEAYKLMPVYQYTTHNPDQSGYVDAKTGEILNMDEIYQDDYYGGPIYTSNTLAKEAADQAMGIIKETIPEVGGMSKEQAERLIREAVGDDLDIEGMMVNNSRYTGNYNGIKGKYWELYWEDKNPEKTNRSFRTVLDSETGKIILINYAKYMWDVAPPQPRNILNELKAALAAGKVEKEVFEEKAKVLLAAGEITEKQYEQRYSMDEEQSSSVEQEYDSSAVIEKIKQTLGHINQGISEQEYKLETMNDGNMEDTQAIVQGTRYIHGIPFEENNIYVGYDKNSKEITRLNYTWYNVPVAEPAKIIEENAAEKVFFDEAGIEKYLIQLKDQEKSKEFLEVPQKELVPVYAVKQFDFSYLDAQTGEFLGYNGNPYEVPEEKYVELKDISESKYEDAILLMNHMNYIREKDGEFNPEAKLSREDAIKWVYLSLNQVRDYIPYAYPKEKEEKEEYFKDIEKDDPYYEYIMAAGKQGIIDTEKEYFYPDKDVTKEDITKWILNALGQKQLAQYSQIFVPPYVDKNDIPKEDWGYVALADYYKIYGDKNTKFFDIHGGFKRDEFVGILYDLLRHMEEQGMLGY